MIPLTLARIAEIVGGELADISPAEAAECRVTGTVEFDSRAVTPGGPDPSRPSHVGTCERRIP